MNYFIGLLQFCTLTLAATFGEHSACTEREYYSPNYARCLPKSIEDEYCNVVIPCRAGFQCRYYQCVSEQVCSSPERVDVCNGRGYYFAEEAALGAPVKCQCVGCWTGDYCQTQQRANCTIRPIDPEIYYQRDWMARHPETMVRMYSDYRMFYPGLSRLGPDPPAERTNRLEDSLNQIIRELHQSVGNAETEGYSIVVGAGAHGVIAAAVYAMSQLGQTAVFAQNPHWPRFRAIVEVANSANASWVGSQLPEEEVDIVEIVTIPNNPDQKHHPPALEGSRKIYDMVYYWPNQQHSIPVKYAEDIMVFSLSKLSSHPGTRIGWALVKDNATAWKMREFISSVSVSPSYDAGLRAALVLDAINQARDTEDDFFAWSYGILSTRHAQLEMLLAQSPHYELASEFGAFFLIKCLGQTEQQCQAKFLEVGIVTRLGSRYGLPAAPDGVVVICIGGLQVEFDVLYSMLVTLLQLPTCDENDVYACGRPTARCEQGQCRDETPEEAQQRVAEEWELLSAGGTRRVYNFGIGSLFNWASRQYTAHPSMPTPAPALTPVVLARGNGIVREYNYCWRYVAMSARNCEAADPCPATLGAVFEVQEAEWPNLRKREENYFILEVDDVEAAEPGSLVFLWGSAPGKDAKCKDYPLNFVSQAYWDLILGGILAWDGQLLDTGRYTWDVAFEKEYGSEAMAALTYHTPSITLEEREAYAIEFIQSTFNTYNFTWKNDRLCPFVGNGVITHKDELEFREDILLEVTAEAIGTGASPNSYANGGQTGFYRIIDDLLARAGVNMAERSAMNCESASFSLSRWSSDNAYHHDWVTWHNNNGIN